MSAIVDFRLGNWQDVGRDITCDAFISDPPFGERTHDGHDAGVDIDRSVGETTTRELDYSFLRPADVIEIVEWWSPRTRGWFVVHTSHDLIPVWERALWDAGRYVFAPLPVLGRHRHRKRGDGPGSCVVHLIVARPRNAEFASWGSLTSRYDEPASEPGRRRIGGKSIGVMRAIVRDYSRPGDLICDPFGGYATTLRAAIEEGRRAVGCERDKAAYAIGRAWLDEPVTGRLFGDGLFGDQGGLPGVA